MKCFNAFIIVFLVIIGIIFFTANVLVYNLDIEASGQYRVEANRIAIEISEKGYENIELSNYQHIVAIRVLNNDNSNSFYESEYEYVIKEINGELYRLDYITNYENSKNIIVLNISIAAISLLTAAVLFYIRQRIIKPFNMLSNVPYELSRGNLTIPVKEQKGKYFGKFIWGIDLLREHLENQKEKELGLQKDKKTLLLSISHDIKTPLGVIELYAKAIEKNLYKDKKKQMEIAASISEKCVEIKKYISDITKASSEDFLNFNVKSEEVYLSQIIDSIKAFYDDKLKLLEIDFSVACYSNCIIFADVDRSVEVLQNIIENAVKYGDGKKIEISFEQEDGYILISVINGGCTLSANELPHIFDSFWRGSNTGSNSGNGLGLYICRKLMHAMDGDIFAECKNGIMCITAVFRMV